MPKPKELTGKQLERLKHRMLSEPCLSPLVGDGEETKKVIDEIHTFLRGLNDKDIESYRDKLIVWRRQLRTARYKDWLSARNAT